MKKKHISVIIMVAFVIITLWVIFSSLSLNEFITVVKGSNQYYLIVGIICMFVFWALEALMMDMMIKKSVPSNTFWTSLKVTIIGQYYSLLTPFASGGQPAQLYVMKKDNIPVSSGTAVLVGKFLIFQITVTLYALFFSIMRIKMIFTTSISAFAVVGLSINCVGLTAIIMMAFKPAVLERLVCKIIVLLHKLKVIKDTESSIEKTKHFITDYKYNITQLLNDKKMTIKLFILAVIQLTFYFSITFFIYKALRLSNSSLLDIISLQALLYMAVSFVPIPGTVGASETGFVLLFGSIFTGRLATVAVLLWRVISYYFGLVFCGLFSFGVYLSDKYPLGQKLDNIE